MKRKSSLVVSVLLALMFIGGGAAFAESSRKIKLFGQIEYWSTEDAFKDTKDAFTASVEDPDSPFFEGSNKVDAGVGGRFGFLSPIAENGFLLGGSLGYIKGPKGTFTLSDGDNPSTNNLHQEDETTFIRALAEARKHFTINEKVGIRIGAGLGLAKGKIEETYSGKLFSTPFSGSASKTWTGVTWEISPSILFKAGETNIEFGITYASLPTLDEDAEFFQFKWNPFGFHLGLEF